jgi:uncharacterized membrane protein
MASRKPARATPAGQTRMAARTPAAGTPAARTSSARGQGAGRPGPGGQKGRPSAQGGATAAAARPGPAGQADQGSRTAAAQYVPPPWVQIATLVLSVGGLGVSVYLTIAHYTSSAILACSDKGVVNCAKVTTSPESVVFGIFPVAVLGLAFYVFMVAVNTPWAWRWQQPLIPWLRTGSVIVGIGFVLYLVYAEIVEIGNICLWCTSVHCITFLLFLILIPIAPFLTGSRPQGAR